MDKVSIQPQIHYGPRDLTGVRSSLVVYFLRWHRSISHGAFIFLYFSSRVSHEEADDRIRCVSTHKAVRVIR